LEIPDAEKTDYLEALRVAPHLVHIESDPVKFLRYFNVEAAARGIVRYWKRRREDFGDRAFLLPMSIAANISNVNALHPFDSIAMPHHNGDRLRPAELFEEDDSKPPAIEAVDSYAVVGSEANMSHTNAPYPSDSIGIPRLGSGRLHPVQLAEDDDSKPPVIPAVMDVGATETPETLKEYRLQLESEMQKLPRAETAMYFDALEAAPPQVWEEESNPDMFLRLQSFNVRVAARRLAMYWQLRSDSFGSQKFESLNQTGEGALERRELTALQTGFLNLLPNDQQGCSILWIDGACLPPDDIRDRCIVYMFSLLAENERSQRDGAVLLYKLNSPHFDLINVNFLERLADIMPLRFKSVHLLSLFKLYLPMYR
jgi:hypothetical protein